MVTITSRKNYNIYIKNLQVFAIQKINFSIPKKYGENERTKKKNLMDFFACFYEKKSIFGFEAFFLILYQQTIYYK